MGNGAVEKYSTKDFPGRSAGRVGKKVSATASKLADVGINVSGERDASGIADELVSLLPKYNIENVGDGIPMVGADRKWAGVLGFVSVEIVETFTLQGSYSGATGEIAYGKSSMGWNLQKARDVFASLGLERV